MPNRILSKQWGEMLDRDVLEEFLTEKLKERKITIPKSISKKSLVETFCRYTEDDYYEWLKDNFTSFFSCGSRGGPEWSWIKGMIKRDSKRSKAEILH